MLIPFAHAQSTSAAAQGGAAGFAGFLRPDVFALPLILLAFYFLLIRPQQARMRRLQAIVAGVKKGDAVVTAGGLIGKVTRVEETQVEIELAPNVRVRAVKSTLAEVTPAGSARPAND